MSMQLNDPNHVKVPHRLHLEQIRNPLYVSLKTVLCHMAPV
jgi:hypothetical protein